MGILAFGGWAASRVASGHWLRHAFGCEPEPGRLEARQLLSQIRFFITAPGQSATRTSPKSSRLRGAALWHAGQAWGLFNQWDLLTQQPMGEFSSNSKQRSRAPPPQRGG